MTIARHYILQATQGMEDALGEALAELGGKVRRLDGCEGVDIMRDFDTPARFAFVERWASVEAYRAGGRLLGKDAFAAVSACLTGPADTCYLRLLTK
jgi:quinol monooxygenase YgiN